MSSDVRIVVTIAALCLLAVVLRALATRGERSGAATVGAGAPPVSEDTLRELVLRGRKIDAIKAYRELHRVDLKDAKEAVERLAERLSRGG